MTENHDGPRPTYLIARLVLRSLAYTAMSAVILWMGMTLAWDWLAGPSETALADQRATDAVRVLSPVVRGAFEAGDKQTLAEAAYLGIPPYRITILDPNGAILYDSHATNIQATGEGAWTRLDRPPLPVGNTGAAMVLWRPASPGPFASMRKDLNALLGPESRHFLHDVDQGRRLAILTSMGLAALLVGVGLAGSLAAVIRASAERNSLSRVLEKAQKDLSHKVDELNLVRQDSDEAHVKLLDAEETLRTARDRAEQLEGDLRKASERAEGERQALQTSLDEAIAELKKKAAAVRRLKDGWLMALGEKSEAEEVLEGEVAALQAETRRIHRERSEVPAHRRKERGGKTDVMLDRLLVLWWPDTAWSTRSENELQVTRSETPFTAIIAIISVEKMLSPHRKRTLERDDTIVNAARRAGLSSHHVREVGRLWRLRNDWFHEGRQPSLEDQHAFIDLAARLKVKPALPQRPPSL